MVALALSATPAFAGRKAAAPPTIYYWSRGDLGSDPSAFYRDQYACIKENPVGTYLVYPFPTPEHTLVDKAAKEQAVHAAEQMVTLCLRARGYVPHAPDGTIIP